MFDISITYKGKEIQPNIIYPQRCDIVYKFDVNGVEYCKVIEEHLIEILSEDDVTGSIYMGIMAQILRERLDGENN